MDALELSTYVSARLLEPGRDTRLTLSLGAWSVLASVDAQVSTIELGAD